MSTESAPSACDRQSPFDMSGDEFRELGHELIDRIADFYDSLPGRVVTRDESPAELRTLLGDAALPEQGTDARELLAEVAPLLFDHSLHNGHPRFMGYITSSAAPMGALADLLAAAANPNLGKWELSPIATEIELRALRWIAQFIGYEPECSGVMVSGGNMANIVAFIAARTAKAPWDIRQQGNHGDSRVLTAYVSSEAHTWVDKAADICGLGSGAVRWIETDAEGRVRVDRLEQQIAEDRHAGRLPFLVVGTGGSVQTGIVDPLRDLAALCAREDLWFHIDGAYGAPAAVLPEASADLRALGLADSIAVDPHKWLYCPIEVACTLTKHRDALTRAFSFKPAYYRVVESDTPTTDFYEYGMQNTRGFRALKVWLMLRSAGRAGYEQAIRDDIRLAGRLYDRVDAHPEFLAGSVSLSIATFRYVPSDLAAETVPAVAKYLDALNAALVDRVQRDGELFVSNAVIGDRYLLRACIVNLRTTEADVDALPDAIATVGRELDGELRPASLRG